MHVAIVGGRPYVAISVDDHCRFQGVHDVHDPSSMVINIIDGTIAALESFIANNVILAGLAIGIIRTETEESSTHSASLTSYTTKPPIV